MEGTVTEMDMITMSRRETKRLHIIHQALDKRITQKKAAELVNLSSRQLRRMLKRVREEGDGGISHRSRGKTSKRRVPIKIKEKETARPRRGCSTATRRRWATRATPTSICWCTRSCGWGRNCCDRIGTGAHRLWPVIGGLLGRGRFLRWTGDEAHAGLSCHHLVAADQPDSFGHPGAGHP